jgi:hypothetical protein
VDERKRHHRKNEQQWNSCKNSVDDESKQVGLLVSVCGGTFVVNRYRLRYCRKSSRCRYECFTNELERSNDTSLFPSSNASDDSPVAAWFANAGMLAASTIASFDNCPENVIG